MREPSPSFWLSAILAHFDFRKKGSAKFAARIDFSVCKSNRSAEILGKPLAIFSQLIFVAFTNTKSFLARNCSF